MTRMNFALIIKNVSKHIHLTKDEENHFVSFLKNEKIKRKEFLLRENEICENSLILTGIKKNFGFYNGIWDGNGF